MRTREPAPRGCSRARAAALLSSRCQSSLRAKSDRKKASFGLSEALSTDGNTALIGGRSASDGTGAAWVFTRSGSSWTQQAVLKLAGSEPTEEADTPGHALFGSGGCGRALGQRQHGADRCRLVFSPNSPGAQPSSFCSLEARPGQSRPNSSPPRAKPDRRTRSRRARGLWLEPRALLRRETRR